VLSAAEEGDKVRNTIPGRNIRLRRYIKPGREN
jgi:hypothetical protein